MEWEIDNWIISKILHKKENIINPWWFETSDSFSFYSHFTWGNRNKLLHYKFSHNKKKNTGKINVKMKEWEWELDVNEENKSNEIIRKHALKTNTDSYLFDYVQRYRFKKSFFDYAKINWKKIKHSNSNIYHQYPVDEVSLHGKEITVHIKILDYKGDQFVPHMYVRDFKDEWIIHVRLMPKTWDKEIIKLCTFRYNKAIPQRIANIFLKITPLKKYLWLKWERKPYKKPFSLISPNAYPEVLVKEWTEIYLKSKCEFYA